MNPIQINPSAQIILHGKNLYKKYPNGTIHCPVQRCRKTFNIKDSGESHKHGNKGWLVPVDKQGKLGPSEENEEGYFVASSGDDHRQLLMAEGKIVVITDSKMDMDGSAAGPSGLGKGKAPDTDQLAQPKKKQPKNELNVLGGSTQRLHHGHRGGCHSSIPKPNKKISRKSLKLKAPLSHLRPRLPVVQTVSVRKRVKKHVLQGSVVDDDEDNPYQNNKIPKIVVTEEPKPVLPLEIDSSSSSASEDSEDSDTEELSPRRTEYEDDPMTNLGFPAGKRLIFLNFLVWMLIPLEIINFLSWNEDTAMGEAGWLLLLAGLYDTLLRHSVPVRLPILCQRCVRRKAEIFEFCKKHQIICRRCLAEENVGPATCLACLQIELDQKEKDLIADAESGKKISKWKKEKGGKGKIYIIPNIRFLIKKRRDAKLIEDGILQGFEKKYMKELLQLNGVYRFYFIEGQQKASEKMISKALQFELAIRKQVMCFKCKTGQRVVTNLCMHYDYCGECLVKNSHKCFECEENVIAKGYTSIEHVFLKER